MELPGAGEIGDSRSLAPMKCPSIASLTLTFSKALRVAARHIVPATIVLALPPDFP